MSGTVIDELVMLLGIEVDPTMQAGLDKFGKGIDAISGFAKYAGSALIATATSVAYFTDQVADSTNELDKLHRLTGLNTDTFQAMGIAAEMVGGNFDNLLGDMKSLTKNMSSPIPGEYNNTLFMLGINMKKANGELKSADEVLLDIADKMEGMNDVEQLQWSDRIGLSEDTLLLLKEGRTEIERLQKQAEEFPLILSEQQLKNAREYTIQMKTMSRVMTYLGQVFTASVNPGLTKVVKNFAEWINANKELITPKLENLINGISDGFSRFYDMITKVKDKMLELLPATRGLFDAFTSVEAISAAVTAILGAIVVAVISMTWEFMLVAGVIIAAGLAFEDFLTYLEGGDYVMGSLVDSVSDMYDGFKEKFPAIEELLRTFASVMKNTVVVAFNATIDAVQLLWQGLKMMGGAIEWILDKTEKGLAKLGWGEGMGLAELTEEQMTKLREKAKSYGDSLVDDAEDYIDQKKPTSRSKTEQKDPAENGQAQLLSNIEKTLAALTNEAEQAPTAGSGEEQTHSLTEIENALYILVDKIHKDNNQDDPATGSKPDQNHSLIEIKKALDVLANGTQQYNDQQAPIPGQQGQQAPSSTHIESTFNIKGDNATGIASETSRKFNMTLQQLSPGPLAPVTN
jgi:hypothetical protein